jgi:hypothetical protein
MNFWFIGSVVLTQAGVSSRFVTKRSSPLAKTSYCQPDQGGASLRLVSGAANCRPWGECRPTDLPGNFTSSLRRINRRPTRLGSKPRLSSPNRIAGTFLTQLTLTYRKIRASPAAASGSYRDTGYPKPKNAGRLSCGTTNTRPSAGE